MLLLLPICIASTDIYAQIKKKHKVIVDHLGDILCE